MTREALKMIFCFRAGVSNANVGVCIVLRLTALVNSARVSGPNWQEFSLPQDNYSPA